MGSMAAYFSRQWASHRQLLRAGPFTDLLLLCRDGPVPLHMILLTTRSPLLASLISPLQEDSPHSVLLPGVRAATVWLLLNILYSGRSVSVFLMTLVEQSSEVPDPERCRAARGERPAGYPGPGRCRQQPGAGAAAGAAGGGRHHLPGDGRCTGEGQQECGPEGHQEEEGLEPPGQVAATKGQEEEEDTVEGRKRTGSLLARRKTCWSVPN